MRSFLFGISPLFLSALFSVVGCTKSATEDSPAPAPAPTATPPTATPPTATPPPAPTKAVGDPRVAQAQAALLPLKKSLQGALKPALAESPDKAVEVCHLEAGPLTQKAATGGVKLGRTSHKLRNPANAQAQWMRLLYARLQQGEPPAPYMVAELPDGSFGYLEPIVTKPLCLTCHGADIPAAVKTLLDKKYPKDEARGFVAGELRGAWWAVLPPVERAPGG